MSSCDRTAWNLAKCFKWKRVSRSFIKVQSKVGFHTQCTKSHTAYVTGRQQPQPLTGRGGGPSSNTGRSQVSYVSFSAAVHHNHGNPFYFLFFHVLSAAHCPSNRPRGETSAGIRLSRLLVKGCVPGREG